jgi:hypothetical protein
MGAHRVVVAGAVTGIVLAGLLTACGSTSKSSPNVTSAPSTAAPTSTVAPTTTIDAVAAKAEITANWTKFFDASVTDINAKLAVMENAAKIGDVYKQLVQKSGGGTSAKVTAVELETPSACNDALGETVLCAKVTFDLLVNGKPALPGYTGYAVLDGGVWKVSQVTNCTLISLGSGKCPA